MPSIAHGLNRQAHEEFIGGVRVESRPSISPHSANQSAGTFDVEQLRGDYRIIRPGQPVQSFHRK
jgi:hypothetical protein